jgi:predicted nucleic acid-binding protein
MPVVADSSPINFLVRLGCEHVLSELFRTVIAPPEVVAELSSPSTPAVVAAFLAHPPSWIQIRSSASAEPIGRLHCGESAANNLAREIHAELILLDDRAARKVAISAGLSVIGLLGVLERAAERNMLDLAEVAGRLPADYRIDQRLVVAAVRRANERRERPTNP